MSRILLLAAAAVEIMRMAAEVALEDCDLDPGSQYPELKLSQLARVAHHQMGTHHLLRTAATQYPLPGAAGLESMAPL